MKTGILKRTNKPSKTTYDLEIMKPTQEPKPVVETVTPMFVETSMPSADIITQESAPVGKKHGSKRVKKLQFT